MPSTTCRDSRKQEQHACLVLCRVPEVDDESPHFRIKIARITSMESGVYYDLML